MIKVILVALMVMACGSEPYRVVREARSHLVRAASDIRYEVTKASGRFNEERLKDLEKIQGKIRAGKRKQIANGRAIERKFHETKEAITDKLVGERADGRDGPQGVTGVDGVNGIAGTVGNIGVDGSSCRNYEVVTSSKKHHYRADVYQVCGDADPIKVADNVKNYY